MASSDIYHKTFDEISELCMKYSRSRAKNGKKLRDGFPRASKPVNTSGVIRIEIGSLLESFKTYILGTIRSQFDALKTLKHIY